MSRVLVGFALLFACLLPAADAVAADPPATPGQLVQRTFTNGAGTRTYNLYVPTGGGAGKPLMVWLHGCGGPGTMQAGHALAKVAEERGFSLIYPVQTTAANPGDCWNWFNDADIHRGQGEASIIAGITTSVRDELGSDSNRVYVGGYSAGGAMSTVMGATYPDVYAAIAPGAGAPYTLLDATGHNAYVEMGPRARIVPAFILQGLIDEISLYAPIGRANALQWLGADDYADDGAANNSVSRFPARVESKVIQTALALPEAVEHYNAHGCEVAQFITSPYDHLLNGALFYYDAGLALQRQMMDFLLAHRQGAC